jgi:hypothetical protein
VLIDETTQSPSSSDAHGMIFFGAKGHSKFSGCCFVPIFELVDPLRNLLDALWYLRTAAEDPTRLCRIPCRLDAQLLRTILKNRELVVKRRQRIAVGTIFFQWISHNISFWSQWPFSRKQEAHRTGNVGQQTVFCFLFAQNNFFINCYHPLLQIAIILF